MKSVRITALCATVLSAFVSTAAIAEDGVDFSLPIGLQNTILSAKQTENKYIFNAVVGAVKADNPAFIADVDVFLVSLMPAKTADEIAAIQALSAIAPAADAPKKTWDGNVEFGANVKTGNTDKQALNIKAKLNNYYDKWENTVKFSVDLGEENGASTDEEYRIKDQLRYGLSDFSYAFGEFEYVNNRFSGYEYRTSELLGYGHHLVKQDALLVTGEVGLGARQAAVAGGDDENSFLGRVGAKIDWDISKAIKLTQDMSVSVGAEAVITESETALKSDITDSLYLKISYDLEHISDVPAGRENLDTVSKVTIGYDF